MDRTTVEPDSAEVAEIEKHKYFLSEKAGYDVGWEFAEQDWKENHAEYFRSDQVEAGGENDSTSPTDSGLAGLFKRLFFR